MELTRHMLFYEETRSCIDGVLISSLGEHVGNAMDTFLQSRITHTQSVLRDSPLRPLLRSRDRAMCNMHVLLLDSSDFRIIFATA